VTAPVTLTLAEFGDEYARCSVRTVRRIVRRDSLPIHRDGNRVLIRREDAEAWLESKRIEHAPQPSPLKEIVRKAVERARERRETA